MEVSVIMKTKGEEQGKHAEDPRREKLKFWHGTKVKKKKIVSDFKALNHPEKKNLYSNSVLEIELP